jgi:hypothetical protein
MLLCFSPSSLSFFPLSFPGYVDLSDVICSGQHIKACDYIFGPFKGPLYMLINKACLAMGKKP